MTLVERPARAPTLRATFGVMFDDAYAGDGIVERVLASPALAESWRVSLAARRG
jgi:hypothetical protein